MLKLLGAVLVLGACSWFGFYMASSFARRPREIRHLQTALQLLESEIVYGATPLQKALKKTGVLTASPVGRIFFQASQNLKENDGLSTYQCWEKAVNEIWPLTCLHLEEKEVILQVGQALGKTDRYDQKKHLRLAVQHLESEGQQAKEEQLRYEKMCKSLGILGGMLIALLMY